MKFRVTHHRIALVALLSIAIQSTLFAQTGPVAAPAAAAASAAPAAAGASTAGSTATAAGPASTGAATPVTTGPAIANPPLGAVTVLGSSGDTGARAVRYELLTEGLASWYGPGFDGKTTSSGQVFDQTKFTAAHPTLAFGTELRVTNLANGKSTLVVVNDRGPHVAGRILDLSQAAADAIGMIGSGVATVRIETVQRDPVTIKPDVAPINPDSTPPTNVIVNVAPLDPAAIRTIQIGAFANEANATKMVQTLVNAGLPAVSEQGADKIFRVLIKNVPIGDVEKITDTLKAIGYSEVILKLK